MKVRYIKKGFGHEVGVVIDTTPKIAGTLLKRGICEAFAGKDLAAEQAAAEQAAAEQAAAEQAAAEQAAAEQAKALEVLKNTDVEGIEYSAMKQIVSALSIATPDQKKATLIEALTAYKATL